MASENPINRFYDGGPFPVGFLWSRPEHVGTTVEEMAALNRGELDLARTQQIQAAFHMATKGLESVSPRGTA